MRNASDAEWLPWKGMKLGNGNISLVWSPSGLRLRHLSCMYWRSSWLCFCLAINVLHIDAKVCSQSLWTALYSIIIILSFFWFKDFTTFFFFSPTKWVITNRIHLSLVTSPEMSQPDLTTMGLTELMHGIIHLQMEGTHKDDWVQSLALHLITQNSHHISEGRYTG